MIINFSIYCSIEDFVDVLKKLRGMDVKMVKCCVWILVFLCVELWGSYGVDETMLVSVDGAIPVRQMPSTLLGVFFEVSSFI